MAVDDNAHRRAMAEARQAAGQLGIVHNNGAGADHDRVVTGAQGVRALARRRPGDPLTLAGRGSDAAIERSCEFERNKRTPEPQAAEETRIDLGRLLGTEPDLDVEPRRTQPAQSLAGDARIRILKSDHHPPYPGGDQRIDAGRGLAPVTTRLETDMGDGSVSRLPRPAKRFGLAMRSPTGLGPAPSDDPAVVYDDTTDRGVRPDGAEPATGERQRCSHRVEIEVSIAGRTCTGLNRHPRRSVRRSPRNPWPRGSCGRPRRNGYRQPDRGSPTPP